MCLSVWLDGLIIKSKAWNMQLHLSIINSHYFFHVLLACIICSHCIITYSKVGRTSKPFTENTAHSLCLLYSPAGAIPTPQKLFRWMRLFSVIMHWHCSVYEFLLAGFSLQPTGSEEEGSSKESNDFTFTKKSHPSLCILHSYRKKKYT